MLIVILSLLVHACGGTFLEYPDQGNVGATWNLSLNQSDVSVRVVQLFLKQEKRYAPFSGTTSDNATVDGTLNGDNIVINLDNADGSTTTLTGTASNAWGTFSGTYTSTGSDGSGTWRANRKSSPKAAISVTPSSATLSCSAGESATFDVTGGTPASYSVTASSNGSLVTLSTTTLTTNGEFTVTAATACAGTDGAIVNLTITDKSTSATVQVTISNP